MAQKQPTASRPWMPDYGLLDENSGNGLLPWSWAVERLQAAPYYWISTTRPNGHPHTMPIWAIWSGDALYFSTARTSTKARNLAANPHCAISVQDGEASVILEGTVEEVLDIDLLKQLSLTYKSKYGSEIYPGPDAVYAVRPAVAFGFIGAKDEQSAVGDFIGASTRWKF